MKLRNHPLMTRKSGARAWPPRWTTTRQDEHEMPIGEVGTLQRVWIDEPLDTFVFMFVEYNGLRYTGTIYFDDSRSCNEIYNLLKTRVGRSIREIGDLDLSYML